MKEITYYYDSGRGVTQGVKFSELNKKILVVEF